MHSLRYSRCYVGIRGVLGCVCGRNITKRKQQKSNSEGHLQNTVVLRAFPTKQTRLFFMIAEDIMSGVKSGFCFVNRYVYLDGWVCLHGCMFPLAEADCVNMIYSREYHCIHERHGANQTKGKSDRHLINRSFLSSLIAPSTFVPVRSLGSSF